MGRRPCALKSTKTLPHKKCPIWQDGAFQEGGTYVGTVTIALSFTRVIITIAVGDETVVIEIPLTN
jgi:hypothetical protein